MPSQVFPVSPTPLSPTSDVQQVKKFHELTAVDMKPLLIISTVFPLRLFPVWAEVDRTKITVTSQFFFWTNQVRSVLLANISSVIVEDAGPFATLTITDISPDTADIHAGPFWKSDAHKLRQLTDSLQLAMKQQIDLSKIAAKDLVVRADATASNI